MKVLWERQKPLQHFAWENPLGQRSLADLQNQTWLKWLEACTQGFIAGIFLQVSTLHMWSNQLTEVGTHAWRLVGTAVERPMTFCQSQAQDLVNELESKTEFQAFPSYLGGIQNFQDINVWEPGRQVGRSKWLGEQSNCDLASVHWNSLLYSFCCSYHVGTAGGILNPGTHVPDSSGCINQHVFAIVAIS